MRDCSEKPTGKWSESGTWRGLVAKSPTQAGTLVEAGSCPNEKKVIG